MLANTNTDQILKENAAKNNTVKNPISSTQKSGVQSEGAIAATGGLILDGAIESIKLPKITIPAITNPYLVTTVIVTVVVTFAWPAETVNKGEAEWLAARKANEGKVNEEGADNTDSEVPAGQAGRGQSKGGKHVPENLKEELGMEEVISNPDNGRELVGKNTDPRWPANEGWEKRVQNVNGTEIHYEYNPLTGEVDDVKIK